VGQKKTRSEGHPEGTGFLHQVVKIKRQKAASKFLGEEKKKRMGAKKTQEKQ